VRSKRIAAALTLALALVGGTRVGHGAEPSDPTTLDCLTANESSLTLRGRNELRAARAQLLVCSAASCPTDIRNECIRRVAEVNQAVPTIVFEAKDASGRNLLEVVVQMDGELLAERLVGTALSIDPGVHTFVFELPGKAKTQKELVILEGEKNRRELVVFEGVGARPPEVSRRVDAGLGGAPEGRAMGPQQRVGAVRIASFVLASVGVASLGVGTAAALVAISRRDSASAVCPSACRDQSGVDLWNGARNAGDVATGAFIVGASAVVGAGALWLVSQRTGQQATSTQVSLGPRLLQIAGWW
jgi:hypothetical protein